MGTMAIKIHGAGLVGDKADPALVVWGQVGMCTVNPCAEHRYFDRLATGSIPGLWGFDLGDTSWYCFGLGRRLAFDHKIPCALRRPYRIARRVILHRHHVGIPSQGVNLGIRE